MRGKIAAPLTRRGEEETTFGVPGGSALPPEGPPPDEPPGGFTGGRTNGDWEPVDVLSAVVALTEAATWEGQGSVRKVPRSSERIPVRSRAVTRKRYVVAGSRPVRVDFPIWFGWVSDVVDQMP